MSFILNQALVKTGAPVNTSGLKRTSFGLPWDVYQDQDLGRYVRSESMIENGWRDFKDRVKTVTKKVQGTEEEKVRRMEAGETETGKDLANRTVGQGIVGGATGGMLGLVSSAIANDAKNPPKFLRKPKIPVIAGGVLGAGIPVAINLLRGRKPIEGDPEKVKGLREYSKALDDDQSMESQELRRAYIQDLPILTRRVNRQ